MLLCDRMRVSLQLLSFQRCCGRIARERGPASLWGSVWRRACLVGYRIVECLTEALMPLVSREEASLPMHVNAVGCGVYDKWHCRIGLRVRRVASAAGRRLWWCGGA